MFTSARTTGCQTPQRVCQPRACVDQRDDIYATVTTAPWNDGESPYVLNAVTVRVKTAPLDCRTTQQYPWPARCGHIACRFGFCWPHVWTADCSRLAQAHAVQMDDSLATASGSDSITFVLTPRDSKWVARSPPRNFERNWTKYLYKGTKLP